MIITLTQPSGHKFRKTLSHDDAVKRLAFLDDAEATTMRYAPTDSGQVRKDYQQEARAIRGAISNET